MDLIALSVVAFSLVVTSCASVGVPHDGNGMTDSRPIDQQDPTGLVVSSASPDAPTTAAPSTSTAVPAVSSSATASAAAPATGDDPAANAPGKPVHVTIGDPKFEGGDVPKAKAALDRLAKSITKCINEHGGLHTATGSIDIKFLVQAKGIAEGVDVESAKGIEGDAKKCVRDAFKKKTMGPPSNDPVGVTIKIELEPREGATP